MFSSQDHSFSKYAKFSEKLTFLISNIRMCAYQGVRNASLENFTYVLNERSSIKKKHSIGSDRAIPASYNLFFTEITDAEIV